MPEGDANVFGAWLVEHGYLEQARLDEAMGTSPDGDAGLGRALMDMRLMDRTVVTQAASNFSGLPYVRLNPEAIDSETATIIPTALCRKHLAVPVMKDGERLTVAAAFPLGLVAIDELSFSSGMDLEQVLADEEDIIEVIERFSRGDTLEQKIGEWDDESLRFIDAKSEVKVDIEDINEANIVKLVNLLLVKAIKDRASDIHIEPGEADTLVRFRVDGVLREENRFTPELHAAIVSRIKVLSNLDIAEKRVPQDGSFLCRTGRQGRRFPRVHLPYHLRGIGEHSPPRPGKSRSSTGRIGLRAW